MRTFKIITALVSLTLLAGNLALAEDHQGQREDDWKKQKHKHQDKGRNQGRGPQEQHGAGPEHQFYRGNQLPRQYRQQIYVVNNWHVHQLPPPPRGHHWVQMGGDYVLVAIATGIIVQLILDSAY